MTWRLPQRFKTFRDMNHPRYLSRRFQNDDSIPSEDLRIVMSANNMTPGEGANIVLYATVTNRGRHDLTAVHVTALLPAGYTYVSDDALGSYTSGTGSWDVGDIAHGVTKVLAITATVEATGSYAFTGTITAPSDDIASNNTSTVTTIPVPPPATDIEVLVTADNNTIDVGQNVVFTVAIHNYGPTNATSLTLAALLPSGVSYVSDNGAGAYVSGTGVWNKSTLAAGASASLQITGQIQPSGIYALTASLTTVSPADTNALNDSSTCTLTANPVADLAVDISTPTLTPNVATNVVLTLQVQNLGPSTASGITATLTLPAGMTYVSHTGGGAFNSTTKIWTIAGSMISGGSASITVTVTVVPSSTYGASFAITTSTPTDFNVANATDTLTLTPVQIADLTVD